MSNVAGMDNHPASALAPGHGLFEGLPVPVCLVNAEGILVSLNHSALSFLGVEIGTVLGLPVMQALGIVPADGGGDAWRRLSPPGGHPRLACRTTTPDGDRSVSVIYTPLNGATPPMGALFVLHGTMTAVLSDVPEWAVRDPVTGLGSRHLWEREDVAWSSRSGCVVFLDLDDLKEVNDLYGHVAGDRLLAVAGKAPQEVTPADALTVRYGGDEFVVLLAEPDEAAAESWAQEAVRHVAGSSPDLPIVPRLSYGVAPFGPGTLRVAVRRADDVLYERKGVLLPASSGGRIILTRDGRAALRRPGDDRAESRLGTFGSGFGAEFEAYFRAQFARAADQAREFVDFVDPKPGTAVVEVGAGSGRITFEGGLAERIGSRGQLLLTDPSGAQLLVARTHATERGLGSVSPGTGRRTAPGVRYCGSGRQRSLPALHGPRPCASGDGARAPARRSGRDLRLSRVRVAPNLPGRVRPRAPGVGGLWATSQDSLSGAGRVVGSGGLRGAARGAGGRSGAGYVGVPIPRHRAPRVAAVKPRSTTAKGTSRPASSRGAGSVREKAAGNL